MFTKNVTVWDNMASLADLTVVRNLSYPSYCPFSADTNQANPLQI